jgi:hypothetical protein
MSSDWEFNNNNTNGIIKKIFCTKMVSMPIKYRWFVVLHDDLHVRLDDPSLDKLKLNETETKMLEEARTNSLNLTKKIAKANLGFIE